MEQLSDTSNLTASPNGRCASSWRSALGKSLISSSSNAKSECRVTRNCEKLRIVLPINKLGKCAAIILVSITNSSADVPFLGNLSSRGKARGIRIILMLVCPTDFSLASSTIKCKALLAISGKGCARSSAIGNNKGFTLLLK